MEKENRNLGGVVLESKKKKRKVGILVFSITLGLVLLLGLSYAWFTLTLNGTKQNVVKVGQLSLVLSEGDAITLENAIPTPIDVALSGEPYHFTVENNGTVDAEYSLFLDNTGTITNLIRFNYALKKDGKIIGIDRLSNLTNSLLSSFTISKGETSEFDLYVWLDANTSSKQAASLTGTYQSNIRLESNQQKEMTLLSALKNTMQDYGGSINDDGENHHLTDIRMSPYIWYSGKMWKAVSYNDQGEIKAITASPVTTLPWGSKTKFTETNIYTWINDTSSSGFLGNLYNYETFLVTDASWNYSPNTSSTFDYAAPLGTSNIVKGPVGLLNTWDAFMGCQDKNSVNMSSGALSNGMLGYYYLGNIFSSNNSVVVSVAHVSVNGDRDLVGQAYGNVSPAVVFKSNVKVISGSGTVEDPYRLKGDQRTKGSLLNTAVSGEYVAFGDQTNYMYRIVGKKSQKILLTSARPLASNYYYDDGDLDESLVEDATTLVYSNASDYSIYPTNNPEYPLAYFLNNEFLNVNNGYLTKADLSMIERDQTWEFPTLAANQNDYKNATKKTATATVGLLNAGDQFSSYLVYRTERYRVNNYHNYRKASFTSNGEHLLSFGNNRSPEAFELTSTYYHPSFYLKSSVKIKSGSGTREDPYILQ